MEKDDEVFYKPGPKQMCTEAFYRFSAEYIDIFHLFFFVVMSATRMDDMQSSARKVLAAVKPEEFGGYEQDTKENSLQLQKYGYLLSSNLVNSMVNNFSSYLSEVIQLVVRKRYEILRSSEKLSTEEILQFSRVSDIVAYIADKKVHELSYGGLKEVDRFISDRLGLSLFADENQRRLLTIFVELRNIGTHNRGKVNDLFIKRVGVTHFNGGDFVVGKKHSVHFDEFSILASNAMEVATRLDRELSVKFKLPRKNLRKQLKAYYERRKRANAKLPNVVPSAGNGAAES